VTFLKRKFVTQANGIVAAPLDPNSRYEMLYWYRDGNDLKETYKALADSHILEAVHYGPTFYRERQTQLVRALATQGVVMPELSRSHSYWINEWYNDGYSAPTARFLELQSLIS